LAGGRVCPVLLLAPDRCPGSASGWLGPGSARGPIAKRRVAPWRRPPGSGDWCGRGKERRLFRLFTVGFGCGVFGVGVSLPPFITRGRLRGGVWCVAPSLTLVLGPWWCWPGDMMIDRVSRVGCGRFILWRSSTPGGGDRLTAGSRPRSHQVSVGVSIASSSCGLRPPRRPYRRARAGGDASGGRSYEPPRWWPVCGRYGP
jgi:hypothetical protein